MKKLFVFIALTFISISFMGNDINSPHAGGRIKSSCPYLNQMMDSSRTMICPYLLEPGTQGDSGQCPYLNGMKNGSSEECPYLKEQGRPFDKVRTYTPPIELIGT